MIKFKTHLSVALLALIATGFVAVVQFSPHSAFAEDTKDSKVASEEKAGTKEKKDGYGSYNY